MTCPASFGTYLRATRLGYHWSDWMQAFVRVRIIDKHLIGVDLAAADYVPNDSKKGTHVVWWEAENAEAALELSPALRAAKFPTKPTSLLLTNEGTEATRMDDSKWRQP